MTHTGPQLKKSVEKVQNKPINLVTYCGIANKNQDEEGSNKCKAELNIQSNSFSVLFECFQHLLKALCNMEFLTKFYLCSHVSY